MDVKTISHSTNKVKIKSLNITTGRLALCTDGGRVNKVNETLYRVQIQNWESMLHLCIICEYMHASFIDLKENCERRGKTEYGYSWVREMWSFYEAYG